MGSELHNWEPRIKMLGGENADELLKLAQDVYDTAYIRGKTMGQDKNIDTQNDRTNVLLSNALSYIMDVDMPNEDREDWYENLKTKLDMTDDEMTKAGINIDQLRDYEPEL